VLIETANGIKVGDVFKDKDTNQIIGEVIDKRLQNPMILLILAMEG